MKVNCYKKQQKQTEHEHNNKDENENNVQFLTKNFSLQLNEQIILKGYDMQADTMFAALLSKPYG